MAFEGQVIHHLPNGWLVSVIPDDVYGGEECAARPQNGNFDWTNPELTCVRGLTPSGVEEFIEKIKKIKGDYDG